MTIGKLNGEWMIKKIGKNRRNGDVHQIVEMEGMNKFI